MGASAGMTGAERSRPTCARAGRRAGADRETQAPPPPRPRLPRPPVPARAGGPSLARGGGRPAYGLDKQKAGGQVPHVAADALRAPWSRQRPGTWPVRPGLRRVFRAGGLQNGGVSGMVPPREPVSWSPKFFSQGWSTALTTDSDCGRLHGNLYSTGLCFSDSASLPGVEGGSQGLNQGGDFT